MDPTYASSASKPLNAMNRLGDMAHFPVAVNAGATANVLLTVTLTWFVQPRFRQPWAPLAWVALVLCVNLLPVVLLRQTLSPTTAYPPLARMDFFRDQHKFSDWVYLAASANMAFWVLTAWVLFAVERTRGALILELALAFFLTFSPVLLRSARSQKLDLDPLATPPEPGPAGHAS